VPDEGATIVRDVIRGETRFEHTHLDDPVIARADGSVLYNFAAAIDDLDAAITHVVRGEDHLSNTPKQLLVLEAALEASLFEGPTRPPLPLYAHLPLLHGPDGKKLSKRHGADSVQELRDDGYLPGAIRNYLALLGWGSGDDATVLSTAELVERFTLERVSRSPSRFDETKLRWLNGISIRALPPTELARLLAEYLVRERLADRAQLDRRQATLEEAATISQDKIQTLADFWPLAGFFFAEPSADACARERWLPGEGAVLLREVREALSAAAGFDVPAVRAALEAVVARHEVKPGQVYQPLRVAISGTTD
jgi:glutamyl-tRNA synthetase